MTENDKLLPEAPADAVKMITKFAEKLIIVMEQESKALAMQDSVAFTAAQEEKRYLLDSYAKASEEFKERLLDFRAVDKALLDKLDKVQRDLKTQTEENSAALSRASGG